MFGSRGIGRVVQLLTTVSSASTSSSGSDRALAGGALGDLGAAGREGARRDGHDQRHAQQLGVGELHAGRLVAVVVQHLDAGVGQALVEAVGRLAARPDRCAAPSATSWAA